MRKLDFTDEKAKIHFETLYDAFILTQRSFQAPSETRIVSKILDKLELLGRPIKRGPIATFEFARDGVVTLEEAEYDLLKSALDQAPWSARGAREATEAMDWFHAAPPALEEKKDESKTD